MVEVLKETAIGVIVFVAVGLVIVRAFERRWPLRTITWRSTIRLDLIALGHATLCSAATAWLCLVVFGPYRDHPTIAALRATSPPVRLLVLLLANDLLYYWYHRALHTFAWRVHRWHHSAPALYWLSGSRGSTPDIVLQVVPLTVTTMLFLAPGEGWLFGTIQLANGFFQHMNVRFRARWLEALIVTPAIHTLHHANDPRLRDKNFSALFTIWDRVFGTWMSPDAIATPDLTTGLDPDERPSVPRMLLGA